MKKNMGGADKLIRLIVVIIIALLSFFDVIQGTLSYVLLGVGVVLLLTTFFNFCPLYTLFGINTCKTKK